MSASHQLDLQAAEIVTAYGVPDQASAKLTPVSNLALGWLLMVPLWCFACDGLLFFRSATSTDTLVATFGTLGGGQSGTADNIALSVVLFTILPLIFLSRFRAMWQALKTDKLFIAVAILIAISFLWSQFPVVSFEWAPVAVLNILTAFYLRERFYPEQQMRLLFMLGSVCLISSYIVVFTSPGYGIEHSDLLGSWRGMYAQKNMCSMGTAFLLPSAFYISAKSVVARLYRYTYIALSVFLIIQTHSATGKITLGALSLFILCMKLVAKLRSTERGFILTALLGAGLSASVLVFTAAPSIAAALGRDPTLTGRTEIWAAIIPAILKHPFLGYGYHAFWRGYQGESASISLAAHWAVPSAHNGILEIWVTLGLVGVTLLLLTLLRACRDAIRSLVSEVTPYKTWCTCIVFLMIVINVDEGEFFNPYGLISMLYVLACLGLARQGEERQRVAA